MKLPVLNSDNNINLAEAVFACPFNEALIHQVVTAYMAGARAGTKAQKTRAQVRGGGAKPFKQKGSGRARAGTNRSPLWRKGGIIFAAQPRNFKQKINKKMFRGAIRSILSELIRQNRLLVVNELNIDAPKTKSFLQYLTTLDVSGNILLITQEIDENLYYSARNLFYVALSDVSTALSDPASFIRANKVIVTEAALKEIEGLLQC